MNNGMGVFLAYALGALMIMLAFYALTGLTPEGSLLRDGVALARVLSYFALGAGLLYTVYRWVRRW